MCGGGSKPAQAPAPKPPVVDTTPADRGSESSAESSFGRRPVSANPNAGTLGDQGATTSSVLGG